MKVVDNPSTSKSANCAAKLRAGAKMSHGAPGPKDTNGGADLSANARNATKIGNLTTPESPNAWPQSRNRGQHYKPSKSGGY